MTTTKATRRPPIHMIDTEADTLSDLALAVEERSPQVAELLLREIGRATLKRAGAIGPDVITMGATAEFVDQASGNTYRYQLVYPKDADITVGKISVLSPVGAGLIGLHTGQSILWPDRDGHERELTVLSVSRPG